MDIIKNSIQLEYIVAFILGLIVAGIFYKLFDPPCVIIEPKHVPRI